MGIAQVPPHPLRQRSGMKALGKNQRGVRHQLLKVRDHLHLIDRLHPQEKTFLATGIWELARLQVPVEIGRRDRPVKISARNVMSIESPTSRIGTRKNLDREEHSLDKEMRVVVAVSTRR